MNTKTYSFKTNINCSGCVAAVKPFLDQVSEIEHWEVNTTTKDKILSVQASESAGQKIIDTIKKAGYTAEQLSETT